MPKLSTWWCKRKSQVIAKISWCHSLGNKNVCTKLHSNLFNSCWDFSVWAKVVATSMTNNAPAMYRSLVWLDLLPVREWVVCGCLSRTKYPGFIIGWKGHPRIFIFTSMMSKAPQTGGAEWGKEVWFACELPNSGVTQEKHQLPCKWEAN